MIRSLGASLLFAAHVALASDLDRLDRLVAANDTVGVLRAFREPGWAEPELLDWLTRRAEAGYVPAQYELALRLSNTQSAQALDWFARGRMSRLLDEAQCKHQGRAGSVTMLIDLGYQSLDAVARVNESAFLASMGRALKSEDASSRASPYWVCNPGNATPSEAALLPLDEREAKRKAQLDHLVRRKDQRSIEARVASRINPDGYRFRLVSEKLVGQHLGREHMVWLDDRRLLFEASDRRPTDRPDPEPTLSLTYGTYLWEVGGGEPTKISRSRADVCFRGSHYRYRTHAEDGTRYIIEGGPSGETRGEAAPVPPEQVYFSGLCDFMPKDDTPYKRRLLPLPGGGAWVVPPENARRGEPDRFLPEHSQIPVVLPFRAAHYDLRYSPFARGYVFVSSSRDRESGVIRAWLLSLDGKWSVVDLPRGPWSLGVQALQPSTHGWLIGTALDGLYLMRDSEIVQLSKGQVKDIAVSHDGCRAALKMRFDNEISYRPYPTHVLELCSHGS